MTDCSSYTFYEKDLIVQLAWTSSLSEEPVFFLNQNWLHVFFGLDISYCINTIGLGTSSKTYYALFLYPSPLSMYPLIDIPFFLVHIYLKLFTNYLKFDFPSRRVNSIVTNFRHKFQSRDPVTHI